MCVGEKVGGRFTGFSGVYGNTFTHVGSADEGFEHDVAFDGPDELVGPGRSPEGRKPD